MQNKTAPQIGFVSIYPGRIERAESGVSGYTKRLAQSIAKEGNVNVSVLAEKNDEDECEYTDENVHVVRCWRRGFPYVFQIFLAITRLNLNIVHIQHEFFLYGGSLSAAMFPILLLLLKIKRINVVTTLHGVIPIDSDLFSNSLPVRLLQKIIIRSLTRIIISLCQLVIVHNTFLKMILETQYKVNPNRVSVIPMMIEKVDQIESGTAKQHIAIPGKTILFLGYIAKYKGLETLLDAFSILSQHDNRINLVIGGGEHPRLRNNREYKQYIDSLKKRAPESVSKKIHFVGFIKDQDLPWYMAASDVVVFPYTSPISASGPFNISISYRKPFIASDIPTFNLFGPPKYLLFAPHSKEELAFKIKNLLEDELLGMQAKLFAEKLGEGFEENKISSMTLEVYSNLLARNDFCNH